MRIAVGGFDNFVRNALLFLEYLVEFAAHEALDREDRAVRVGDLLALGGRPDEPLAVLRERDDGRSRPAALRVRDDGGLAALEDGHARVRRAEVDADCLCHAGSMPPGEKI